METPFDVDGAADASLDSDDPIVSSMQGVFLIASVLALGLVFLTLSLSDPAESQITEQEFAPSASMLSWVPKDEHETKTYVIENYTLTLSTHIHGNGERAAMLEAKSPGGEQAKLYAQVGFAIASAHLAVGQLDPSNPTPQIIFTSYSGGLHCCTKITVLELIDGRWRKIELGRWDSDPLPEFPSDVDGDGTPDFVLKDDRFDYAFGPYTDSHKPPRIFNIKGARAVDASHARRYAQIYDSDLKHAHAGCLKHKNSACAAFVADATRIGKRDWAWEVMLANYRRATDWDFPMKCKVPLVMDVCPGGKAEQFREFPEALEWFLADKGYTERPAQPEG